MKQIALYMRISREDEYAGESGSITRQRELLYDFVRSSPSLAGLGIMEFSDDGYSGTNFGRPGVQGLLDALRNGVADCVVVKDFSRFGRNYLEVGNYLEQIFPFLGIRFISVNDHYDSADCTTGLEFAFKYLLHDLYSRDISKKVRTAKAVKMKQGEFLSAYAPFGYQKDPDDKNRLAMDEEAARIVREIYELAESGVGTTRIARLLNDGGVPTPDARHRAQGAARSWSTGENVWTRAAVYRILKDERYTGKLVGGKSKMAQVGGKAVRVASQDWIVAARTHEAVIPQARFDAVQAVIAAGSRGSYHEDPNRILVKKVKCPQCGHFLWRKGGASPYYFCETARFTQGGCCKERIGEQALLKLLLAGIQVQIRLSAEAARSAAEHGNEQREQAAAARSALEAAARDVERLKAGWLRLYEQYKAGALSRDAYLAEKGRCENNLEALRRKADVLGEQAAAPRLPPPDFSILPPRLTRQLADALLEAVYIHDGAHIEIVWSWAGGALKKQAEGL